MLKIIVAVLTLFILPSMALSHSPLEKANPIDGDVLTEAPKEYKMQFKLPAKLIKFEIFQMGQNDQKNSSFLKTLLKKSTGKMVDINYKPALVLLKNHVIKLPNINPGSYEVRWRAMGEDGHVLKGILTFEIKGK